MIATSVENQKTILVIEDEVDILTPIRDFLKSENYKILSASNGQEAMDILKISDLPNLILLDMKMPIMNGWEFASEFQKKYNQPSPIIAMTAAGDAKERARNIKAVGWIEKPFDLDFLLDKIKKFEK
jgi:DNA-binding response OmpR family regulator